MHRSRSHTFRGQARPNNFDGRRFSPPRRFDSDGPGDRRFNNSFRNRSPPRGWSTNHPQRGGHREERPMGAPFSQLRPFGTNRPMFQLRVENLCGDIRDQVLKQELLMAFRQHGNCSVYVVDQGRGMSKEAYITFWSLEESRNARRCESEKLMFDRPMFIFVQREPRVFSTSRPPGQPDMRRDSSDRGRRSDFRLGDGWSGGPRSEGFRGNAVDDSIPTRTLFVGNLDSSIPDALMYEIFGKYGSVEHVDIKPPRNGAIGTFAFVKFSEIASAKDAKQHLNQTMIGGSRIRLGYGRGTPSARIHISGLGSWCSLDWLEREFDRFGAIHHIEYSTGARTALVSFDSVDAASAAAREMNKAEGKDVDHAIVVSFAEGRGGGSSGGGHAGGGDWDEHSEDRESGRDTGDEATGGSGDRHRRNQRQQRNSSTGSTSSSRVHRHSQSESEAASVPTESSDRSGTALAGDRDRRGHESKSTSSSQSGSHSSQQKRRRDTSADGSDEPAEKRPTVSTTSEPTPAVSVAACGSMADAAQHLEVVWTGALGLRSMSFPMRMHVVSGDAKLAASYLRGDVSLIAITQRLRLDTEKLEEVRRRMTSCGPSGHCVLLALPADNSAVSSTSDERTSDGKADPPSVMQTKPLRNLVMFLKQKQAAGVAQVAPATSGNDDSSSTGKADDATPAEASGVLHAFPPGEFAREQLSPGDGGSKLSATAVQDEDHLVIVIVTK